MMKTRWQHLAEQLGLDWIKVEYPFDSNGPYEESQKEITTRSFLGSETFSSTVKHECPRVEWAVSGERFFGFIPIKLRARVSEHVFVEKHEMIEDDEEMMNELVKMIKS